MVIICLSKFNWLSKLIVYEPFFVDCNEGKYHPVLQSVSLIFLSGCGYKDNTSVGWDSSLIEFMVGFSLWRGIIEHNKMIKPSPAFNGDI